jgi:hypothetical protein
MICPDCIKKDHLLAKVVKAWKESKEADRHYQEGTQAKAESVGKAIHFDELMKGLDNPFVPPPSCDHAQELEALRDIARLAGEWGIALAELQVKPTEARRKRAIEVARHMSAAISYLKQIQGERN